ncbi:MAG: hypothetical protein H8E55_04130 [Pelagibacterales bacterium]|nr:hypothetical protein [Pelagibacterales bacterium]
MFVPLKTNTKHLTKKELFDLLKEPENFKEILERGFCELFDADLYNWDTFRRHLIIDSSDDVLDIKIFRMEKLLRNIKFKLDICESDLYDVEGSGYGRLKSHPMYEGKGGEGYDHHWKDAVPCISFILKSLEDNFKVEICFIIYDKKEFDANTFISSKTTTEQQFDTKANIEIINQYLNKSTCSLDINCWYDVASMIQLDTKFDSNNRRIKNSINYINMGLEGKIQDSHFIFQSLSRTLIDGMLRGSFRLFLAEIDDGIIEVIKKLYPKRGTDDAGTGFFT